MCCQGSGAEDESEESFIQPGLETAFQFIMDRFC